MIIIKSRRKLKKLVNKDGDLIFPNDDLRIEFEPTKDEIRDVFCRDLFLMNDNQRFDFNGRDFNGRDFNGFDFNGRDFNGRDFNGFDFNGRDFNGRDFNGFDFEGFNFNGRKVSYYAFFNCYGSMRCESYEGRRTPHAEPVCRDGKIEIIKYEEPTRKMVKDMKIEKTILEKITERDDLNAVVEEVCKKIEFISMASPPSSYEQKEQLAWKEGLSFGIDQTLAKLNELKEGKRPCNHDWREIENGEGDYREFGKQCKKCGEVIWE